MLFKLPTPPTDHLPPVGLIMKHKPFQVDIVSRGPNFSKVVSEACKQAQSDMKTHTLEIRDVVVGNI